MRLKKARYQKGEMTFVPPSNIPQLSAAQQSLDSVRSKRTLLPGERRSKTADTTGGCHVESTRSRDVDSACSRDVGSACSRGVNSVTGLTSSKSMSIGPFDYDVDVDVDRQLRLRSATATPLTAPSTSTVAMALMKAAMALTTAVAAATTLLATATAVTIVYDCDCDCDTPYSASDFDLNLFANVVKVQDLSLASTRQPTSLLALSFLASKAALSWPRKQPAWRSNRDRPRLHTL
ncbi:hypothetical protein EV122DRAFT_283225 [Schizophyllum commune]